MGRRGPKPWTNKEQEEFLLSKLSEYIICQQTKVYERFLLDTWSTFEARWPERNRADSGIPMEGDLTEVQEKSLSKAKIHRKLMIKRWYRWQTNVARMARSGGLKGALNLGETLNGGDKVSGRAPQEVEIYSQIFYNERVKGEADAAIEAEGITARGEKLAKRKDLTRTKYAGEDDGIKAEVQARHRKALASWEEKRELVRAGVVQGVEQEEKIRAFSELGAHLDRIFRHLSHKTGGLKFTCIAGGRNPATGDIVVLNYHLGETKIGNEFPAQYARFGEVQTAYADFVKLALAHDDDMRALADAGTADEMQALADAGTAGELWALEDAGTADETPQDANDNDNNSGECNKSEVMFWEGGEAGEEKVEEENGRENEGRVMDNIEMGLNGLYQFDVTDDQMSIDTSESSLDMTEVNNFLASLLPVPSDPFAMTTGPPSGLEYFDFSFMNAFDSESFDDQYSQPVVPAFPANMAMHGMHSSTPLPHYSEHLLVPTTPTSTSGLNVTDPNTFDSDPLASLVVGIQEDSAGPRRTTRRHVPSTREHVLNSIGSSDARVRPPVSVDKENDKRKANTAGMGQQHRK